MNKDHKETKDQTYETEGVREKGRDDRKEVRIKIPLPFSCEVTATVMYNPSSGKLIR